MNPIDANAKTALRTGGRRRAGDSADDALQAEVHQARRAIDSALSPHYWPQMKNLALPKYQFTCREIRSGLLFLGYAHEKSASYACLFAQILLRHLQDGGIETQGLKVQTDNGPEFVGCYRGDRTRDGIEAVVAGFGAVHKRIPPGAWSYNSDVETVHATIETEFFDLENFANNRDFHRRVASYQAWYNLVRPNSHKDHQTPWQIIQKLRPQTPKELVRLPPLMLEWLGPDYITREELAVRGYDMYSDIACA